MKRIVSILTVICILLSLPTLIFANVMRQNENDVDSLNSSSQNISFETTVEEPDNSFIEYVSADATGIADRSNPLIPSSVDLSNLLSIYLPTIADQGSGNSFDAAYSSTYYQYTYEANRSKGITTTPANTYCPQFPYSMTYSSDGKTSLYSCYNVLNSLGCLKYSDYDSSIDLTNTTVFKRYCSDNTSARLEALHRRANITGYYIESTDPLTYIHYVTYNNDYYEATDRNYIIDFGNNASHSDVFDSIKYSLSRGSLLSVECNGSWYVRQNADGDYVIVSANSSSDRKALTIVGYDDNFKVDINDSGSYEPHEKGAFLAVDSHGTTAPQHNGGYIWILYDAFNRIGFNSMCNTSSRVPFLVEESYNTKGYDQVNNDDITIYMKRHLFYRINIIEKDLSVIGKISYVNSHVYNSRFSYVSSSLCGDTGGVYKSYPISSFEPPNIYNYLSSGDLLFDLSDYYCPLDGSYNYRLLFIKIVKNIGGNINISSISLFDDQERLIKNVSPGFNMNSVNSIVITDEILLIKGDLDYDGQLTQNDKSLIQAYIVGNYDLSYLQYFLGDLNGDGIINSRDALLLTQLINNNRDD